MFIIDIFKFILNVIYLPFKLLKPRNKILFLSRQYNKLSLEYSMVIDELKRRNKKLEIVTVIKKIDNNFMGYIKSFFLLFVQMYHITTSRVVVTDGYSIPISLLKHRKNVKFVQLWHANGIIKKIGLQTLESRSNHDRKLAIKMNMHKNYDYVISSSSLTGKVFEEAFGVASDKVMVLGTPVLDYIYYKKNLKKEKLLKKYNINDNKKIIVYLPTYRKNAVKLDNIINNIDFDKYQLVTKLHPIDVNKIVDDRVIVIKGDTSEDVISMADYVITDYSNVAFESILTNKKTFFYIYDYEEYKKDFGLNIDIEKEIPEITFRDFSLIMKKIDDNLYDMKGAKNFANKYIECFDGKSCNRITKFLLHILEVK